MYVKFITDEPATWEFYLNNGTPVGRVVESETPNSFSLWSLMPEPAPVPHGTIWERFDKSNYTQQQAVNAMLWLADSMDEVVETKRRQDLAKVTEYFDSEVKRFSTWDKQPRPPVDVFD